MKQQIKNTPKEQAVKPFPQWVNWLLALLLALSLILLIYEKSRNSVRTPEQGQETNTMSVAALGMKGVMPPPADSNTPPSAKFVSRRTRIAGEDDINAPAPVAENTNWVSAANAGVAGSIADAYASLKSATNTLQTISVTPRQRRLVEIARKTFTRKNNPAYENDRDLTEVANTVAGFNLHYPSRSDCQCLVDICKKLEQDNRYLGPTGDAIEGSRYLFENEIKMTDRGFYRYGRIWVDANGLAQINASIAEREKRMADDLAKQRQQEQARSAERKSQPSAPVPRKTGLKGPSYQIKRIGEN